MATSSAEETSSLVGSQHDNDGHAEADDILYRDEISLVDDDDSLPPSDLDAEADVDVAALVDELELDLDLEGDAEVRSHGTSAEAETVKAKPFASKSDGGGSSYEIDVDKFENEIRGSNRSSQTGSGRELSDLDVSNPSFLSDSCGSIDVDQTRAFSRRFSYVAETARRAAAEKNERMKENLRRTSERPPSDAHSPASDRDPAVPPVDRSTSTAPGGVAHSVGGLSLDEDVAKVDEILNRTAVYVVVFWIGLVALSYAICPPDRIVWLEGTERNACLVELSILATAVVMKHGPLLWEINLIDLSPPGRGPTGKGRSLMSAPRFSGILVGGLVVQGIAILTAVIMVCFPVPVMVDPVLGSRVHLIRWCEWTPLAGFMTLMTECIDAPIYDGSRLTHDWRAKFVLSANETVSTLCGFFFPFCPNLWTWSLVMAFSTVTYSAILFRYAQKRRAFRNISRGNSVDEIELYDRSRMSLALLGMCCVIWTGILVAFFASNAGHFVVPASWTIFHDPAATMIEECFMDLVAKILYMALIIEAHYAAFDEAKRANRRLAELKNTMSVVWENSSDTVAISVRKVSGNVTSMVSPSFFRPALIARKRNNTEDVSAIVMELACKEIQKKRDSFTAASAITTLNLPRVLLRVVQKAEFAGIDLHSTSGKNSFDGIIHEGNKLDPMSLRVLAFTDMLSRAWQSNRDELVFEHDAILQEGGNRTKFEVKVTRLEENAIVVVVRDVSERYRRFEAEKRFVFETTARQKDAEANRFTRHEVKNGLLAAIEICGNIREQFSEDFNLLQKENEVSLVTEQSLKTRVEHISELDRTLHEVLDIVLAETMARDVIHEMYIPRMERVDVNYILTHTRGFTASHKQFSVVCNPSPLPILLLDQGLFKCIHGNAIRNALKYGEKGGPIRTEATYYFETGWLEMKVINLPGPGHAQLVAMGPRASELVFSHGTRLHKDSNSKQRSHSAGDGAWIMHKCATILGGSVQITFEQDHTEFVFRAPCKVYDAPLREADHFHLPSGVWGIAIDDSKIQRKLLRRFFVHAGIQEHHQIILGQNNEEISSFVEFVVDFIKRHPNNLFLIIVDENLELGDGISSHETISGSECIQRIRVTLDSENEKKMLALVRSANDSPQDLAIYTSRAHGYMPKVPLQGMSVREMVAPLWAERFPLVKRGSDNEPEEPDPEDRVTSIESLRDLTLISPAELKSLLEQVDALAVRNADNNLANRWPVLWEKLHQLKGDLKTVNVDDKFTRAIKEIESMRGGTAPADFMSKWLVIRTDVVFDSGK